jgi:hypothetical protein
VQLADVSDWGILAMPGPTLLPETGGRFTVQVFVATGVLVGGVGMTMMQRRRETKGLARARLSAGDV